MSIKTRDMRVGFDTRDEKSFACRNFFRLWFCPGESPAKPLSMETVVSIEALLVGQTRAALRTAAGQHLAAVRRVHALAEAMLLGALALLRLLRSLHSSCTSLLLDLRMGTGIGPVTEAGICRCLSA